MDSTKMPKIPVQDALISVQVVLQRQSALLVLVDINFPRLNVFKLVNILAQTVKKTNRQIVQHALLDIISMVMYASQMLQEVVKQLVQEDML